MQLLSRKALYKTISWRIVSIIVSFILSYYFLGSIDGATHYTLVYNGISVILYYFHELIYKWLRLKGKL